MVILINLIATKDKQEVEVEIQHKYANYKY